MKTRMRRVESADSHSQRRYSPLGRAETADVLPVLSTIDQRVEPLRYSPAPTAIARCLLARRAICLVESATYCT